MVTIISILVLAYLIMGKDASSLLGKLKNVDWQSKMNVLYRKIQPYALKAGRVATRPLLQFYYVLNDEKTTTLERVLIYAAIIYTVSPVDLLPRAVYGVLGVLDDGVAMAFVYKKVKDKITPEINAKVNETLNEWFGAEYEVM